MQAPAVFHLTEKFRSPPVFRHGRGRNLKFLPSSRMRMNALKRSFLFFLLFCLQVSKFLSICTNSFFFLLLLFQRIYLTGGFSSLFLFFCRSFLSFFRICSFCCVHFRCPRLTHAASGMRIWYDGGMTVHAGTHASCRVPPNRKNPPPFFRHGIRNSSFLVLFFFSFPKFLSTRTSSFFFFSLLRI